MPVLKNSRHSFKIIIFLSGFIMSLLIFYIDYKILGSALTFNLVYLLPIVLVCWFSGMWPGIILSVACTVEWAILQSYRFVPGTIFYSHLISLQNWPYIYLSFIFCPD